MEMHSDPWSLLIKDPLTRSREKGELLQACEHHNSILHLPQSGTITTDSPANSTQGSPTHPLFIAIPSNVIGSVWRKWIPVDSDLIFADLENLVSEPFRHLHRHHQLGWCLGLRQSHEPRSPRQMEIFNTQVSADHLAMLDSG
jgi:hypothetical protein